MLLRRTTTALTLAGCIADLPIADDGSGSTNGSTSVGSSGAATTASTSMSDADGSTMPAAASSSSSSGDGPKLDVAASETDPGIECIGGNDLVWVLALNEDRARQTELSRFDPSAVGFEWVADLDCIPYDKLPDTPLSLGVDHRGSAWMTSDLPDALWHFDLLADDPCTTLETVMWEGSSYSTSLAFIASDPDALEEERLILHDHLGQFFAEVRFDLPGVPVEFIAASPFASLTLTGSADDRLFGVGGADVGAEGEVVALDLEAGSVIDSLVPAMTNSHVAFFGGDLIVFEVNPLGVGGFSPHVHRIDLDESDGGDPHSMIEIFGEADEPPNLWIRGVASPTCVPVTPAG